MVDKMDKMTIIIGATPLSRTGREPGTGALSHSIINQTEYFGFKATRLITGLFKGVATTNSNRSDWAGGFLLTKNRQAGPSADTLKPALTTANLHGGQLMAQSNIPLSGDFNNSPTPESNPIPLSVQINLTQRNIDTLMAAIITQMEALATYMKELTALKQGVSYD